jgi:multidrug efflux pump subunit AcrB
LEETILLAPNGQTIPLLEAVELKQGVADTEINRFNGTRSITIQANVEPREQAGLIKAELQQNLIPELTKRYPSISFSFEGRQKDMVDGLKVLGLGFLLAVVVIYVLLAIPFNSYLQPVIIMFSIPFGIVGAVIGHLIMGYSLSIMSMFGIVALTGVVVNDSLVLIDLANRNMKGGMGAFDAVTTASVRRFRPIFLTSVTTFFGLAPMILETSPQARFLIPMAISLGFGIIFATVIALLIVPCLFIALKDLQKACNSILSLGSVNEVSPHLENN